MSDVSGYRPSTPRLRGGFVGIEPGTRYKSVKIGLPASLDGRAYANIDEGLRAIEARKLARKAALEAPEVEPEVKVAEVKDEGSLRVASLKDLPESFKALGGGFYREGHFIWELRAGEDEEGGYVLTRKREEMAVDLRGKTASQDVVREPVVASAILSEDVVVGKCPSCLWVGQRVAFITQGQVLPVVVIQIEDGGTEATVEDDAGTQMQAPLDLIVTDMTVQAPSGVVPGAAMAPVGGPQPSPVSAPMCAQPTQVGGPGPAVGPGGCDCDRGCECPCHVKGKKKGPVQGMEPKVEPSSKDQDAQPAGEEDGGSDADPDPVEKQGAVRLAFLVRARASSPSSGQIEAGEAYGQIGQNITPARPFKPQYMGGRVTLQPGTVYQVEGSHLADPKVDRRYDVPNPILPYPNASKANWPLNDRIRLVPKGGGDYVFVTPMELKRLFSFVDRGVQPKPDAGPKTNDGKPPRAPGTRSMNQSRTLEFAAPPQEHDHLLQNMPTFPPVKEDTGYSPRDLPSYVPSRQPEVSRTTLRTRTPTTVMNDITRAEPARVRRTPLPR